MRRPPRKGGAAAGRLSPPPVVRFADPLARRPRGCCASCWTRPGRTSWAQRSCSCSPSRASFDRGPSRPKAGAEEISTLRERKDLNLIFLVVDTLRADRLGAYGYARPTSPEIDALASTGILFRHVYAQSSWTKTSMASLWTGTYPARNGVLRYDHAIPDEALLPAEILRNAGFRTAGIWRNGWVAPNFGFYQGFDFYLNPKPGRTRAQLQRSHPAPESLSGTDEDVADSAVAFLDSYGRERFFLYLHSWICISTSSTTPHPLSATRIPTPTTSRSAGSIA
jgi:hypothetical protein